MAAAQAVEEAKLKTEALAILQKQWEESFVVAIDAIARSKVLKDAVKKAKEASQQSTQADEEVDDEEMDDEETDDEEVDDEDEVSDKDEDGGY